MIVVVAVLLAALAIAAILGAVEPGWFTPYFGALDPVLATGIVLGAGFGSLLVLRGHGVARIFDPGRTGRGLLVAAAWASVLAVAVVGLDLIAGFPEDINVPFPWSVLFYPLMAAVAESVFHLVPLALFAWLAARVAGPDRAGRWTVYSFMLAALLEPTFQVAGAGGVGISAWANGYLWVHLLVFNALQLRIFRRYDFVSVYAFRIVYYFHWHIAWGYLRLGVIF